MAPQVLTDLTSAVAAANGAMSSATTLINGIAARVQAAVDKAIAGGATPAELAPIQAEIDSLNASSNVLSAAVVANP